MNIRMLSQCLLLSTLATVAQADNAELGKQKSVTCIACHGANGISPNPQWPNLAGQKKEYLISSLKSYRDGDRKDSLMSPMAASLSDDDIVALAAYYSSLENH